MPILVGEAGAERRLPTLDDLDARGRRVLVRVDYNVPLEDGRVADDTRIRASRDTVDELRRAGAAVILMSHLGRPEGRDSALSMAPVAKAATEILGAPVAVLGSIVGGEAEAAAEAMAPGDVALLENLRFESGEGANDPSFARGLARLGDAFVNDAFGTAHRAAASTVGVPALLPGYAGRLMERELTTLARALFAPARPLVVILGGAKISGKIGVLRNLLPRADAVLVGGGMANTFLAANGIPMGESLVEADRMDTASELLASSGGKLLLPVDLVVADAFNAHAHRQVRLASDGVPSGWRALDIGPSTVGTFRDALTGAATVVWNGPMGAFEMRPFADGTFALAQAVASLEGALTIVGGGDSVAALGQAGLSDRVGWVSTGGGAMLSFMAGEELPAVVALTEPHPKP